MLLSIVIPAYNEEEVLPVLLRSMGQVMEKLDCEYELVFVNDGSRDRTLPMLLEAAAGDQRIKVLSLSRNFGHQIAITAGLDFAAGDAVVVMDADLQDPPEILMEMVKLYREGYDVVSAQRISRQGDSFYKLVTASFFYWLMRKAVDERLVPEVGDFRLFSRGAILAIRGFREQHRFMRGLVAWLGLKEAILPFHRQSRAAGVTKYPTWKMIRFAWTAITSFSGLPLRACMLAGAGLTFFGFVYFIYVAFLTIFYPQATVRGWTTLVFFQVLFSGATLLAIGLVGDYIARIYEESKNRPLYVLQHMVNLEVPELGVSRVFILPENTSRQFQGEQQ